MRYAFVSIVFLFIATACLAQDALLVNVYNRNVTSLNGYWKYIVDPYENGYYNYRYEPFDEQETPWKSAFFLNSTQDDPSELLEYNFDLMDSLRVPGDWNTQKERLFYYEGTVWYKKSFEYQKSKASNRVFLYFEAANYQADVYFNGTKLGTHVGGFTPFNFEVTELLKAQDNFVVVKVDNKRVKEGIPTLNTDWWNYGGLTRDVKLVELGQQFVQDYFLRLDPNNNKRIVGHAQLNGNNVAQQALTLAIEELGITQTVETDSAGRAQFCSGCHQHRILVAYKSKAV